MLTRAKIQAAVVRAFAMLGDVPITVTLKMGPNEEPNIEEDTSSTAYAHTVTLQVLRYNANELATQTNQQAGSPSVGLTVTKETLLINAADLPTGAVPSENDVVFLPGDAEQWDVYQVTTDPANVTYSLAIR